MQAAHKATSKPAAEAPARPVSPTPATNQSYPSCASLAEAFDAATAEAPPWRITYKTEGNTSRMCALSAVVGDGLGMRVLSQIGPLGSTQHLCSRYLVQTIKADCKTATVVRSGVRWNGVGVEWSGGSVEWHSIAEDIGGPQVGGV